MSGGAWAALGVAVLATHSWRVLAAIIGPRVARSRRATAAIDGMACALVSGIVASMVLNPGGALGGVLGAKLAKRLAGTTGRLTTIFAGLIFAVAAYMLWKSAAAFA